MKKFTVTVLCLFAVGSALVFAGGSKEKDKAGDSMMAENTMVKDDAIMAEDPMKKDDAMMAEDPMKKDDTMMAEDPMKKDDAMMAKDPKKDSMMKSDKK